MSMLAHPRTDEEDVVGAVWRMRVHELAADGVRVRVEGEGWGWG